MSPAHIHESFSVRTNDSNKVVLTHKISVKSPNVSAAKKVQRRRTAKLIEVSKKQGENDDLNQELQTPLFKKEIERNDTLALEN